GHKGARKKIESSVYLCVPCSRLFSYILNRIPQDADTFDGDLHHIASHHRTYSPGCSGGDQVTGIERHHLRDIANNYVQGENEIARVAVLSDLVVHPGLHANALPGVDFVGHHRPNRTKRIEPLGARPLAIFVLKVASGEVVHAGVAENVGSNILI